MMSRTQNPTQNQQGMTLLEILLYVSISGAVIFAASGLLSIIYEVKQKGMTIQAVEEEGTLLSYSLERYMQNASHVFTPELYKISDTLGTTVVTNNKESNVYLTLDKGVIYSATDNGEKIALTSSSVVVSDLAFKYFGSSAKGFLNYSFTLTSGDLSGRNSYSKTFYGGASLR